MFYWSHLLLKRAATKLLIVDLKKKEINKILSNIFIQLTNAVLTSQRHKIESSGFLTIDVLYKKKKKKKKKKHVKAAMEKTK